MNFRRLKAHPNLQSRNETVAKRREKFPFDSSLLSMAFVYQSILNKRREEGSRIYIQVVGQVVFVNRVEWGQLSAFRLLIPHLLQHQLEWLRWSSPALS